MIQMAPFFRPLVRRSGLASLLCCALSASAQADTLRVSGEAPRELTWAGCGIAKHAFMHDLAQAFEAKTGIHIELAGGGATRGLRDILHERSDIGGSCRHSLALEAERGGELVPVAWDAIVAIVHPTNPVDNLSLSQLRDLLSGKILNWSELQAGDKGIQLVVRSQGRDGTVSGVGMMARELLFHNASEAFSSHAVEVRSSGPLERMVERQARAIGLTGVSSARHRAVKVLRLNQIEPSYANIVKGAYPLFRPLYLVIPKAGERRALAKQFTDFALSEEGQAVLKRNGTVTLQDGQGLWPKYRQMMDKAGIPRTDY